MSLRRSDGEKLHKLVYNLDDPNLFFIEIYFFK